MKPSPVILLLAAGASTRMRGGDKQMELINGQTQLRRICDFALSTGMDCFVTLPNPNHPRYAEIQHFPITPVFVDQSHLGMGQSIATGMAAVPDTAPAVILCPTDLPEMTQHHFQTLARNWSQNSDKIHRGFDKSGLPGHPVLFPNTYFETLRQLNGDMGAKSVLKGQTVIPVAFDDYAGTTDLDTPEDWARWRMTSKNTK